MLKVLLKNAIRTPITNRTSFRFCSKSTEGQETNVDKNINLINWREMMEKEKRNVMKNYDNLLPGLYVRNDEAMEFDMW